MHQLIRYLASVMQFSVAESPDVTRRRVQLKLDATNSMTTRDRTVNITLTSAMLGELVLRSVSLAAAVSLVILLLAALFSPSL